MAKERAERVSQRDRKMERDILAEVPESAYSGNSEHYFAQQKTDPRSFIQKQGHNFENIPEEDSDAEIHDASPQPEATVEEELAEAQRLAESRRKMQELNQDREHQKMREKNIREEKAQGKRTKSEAPSPEEERRRRAEEELKEKRRQDSLRREKLHQTAASDRAQRHKRWNDGPWDENRAIERFRQTCRFFDDAKFSAESLPLTWIDIPWPTLEHPNRTKAQDITWESVTKFFHCVRASIRDQNYREFLKTNVRRFHPDRWPNRFNAIIDEDQRNEIEMSE